MISLELPKKDKKKQFNIYVMRFKKMTIFIYKNTLVGIMFLMKLITVMKKLLKKKTLKLPFHLVRRLNG